MAIPSNEELQHLLDTAKPGDWQFQDHEEWEHVAGPEYPPQKVMIAHAVEVDGVVLFWNSNDDVLEDYPGNLRIAALSRVLAAEVIRLREENQRMQERVNKHEQETAPTIIHTVEELEAIDPDTLIQPLLSESSEWPQILTAAGLLAAIRAWEGPWLPAAKVAEGARVRAAREALEEA